MSTTRIHSEITFTCDECWDVLETGVKGREAHSFHEALGVFKEKGWSSRKNGHEWQHFCSTCK